MAAIAQAESSGDPTNTTGDNGTSYGLYQIHWTVHPQFDPNQLTNAQYNTDAAIQLSGNGQNLKPWSTWNSYVAGAGHGFDVISKILGPYTPGMHPSGAVAGYTGGAGSTGGSSGSSGSAPAGTTGNSWLDAIGKIPFVGPGVEAIASAGIVGAGALTLLLIGGIWLVMGNQTSRTIVTNAGETAAKAAAMG